MAPVISHPLLPLDDKEILVFELNVRAGYQNFIGQELGLPTIFVEHSLACIRNKSACCAYVGAHIVTFSSMSVKVD